MDKCKINLISNYLEDLFGLDFVPNYISDSFYNKKYKFYVYYLEEDFLCGIPEHIKFKNKYDTLRDITMSDILVWNRKRKLEVLDK
jgi:hypothetical protein